MANNSNQQKKKGISAGTVTKIGVTAAALTGAAYYFLGPKGKAHQKKAQKWTMDAKNKIMKKVEATKDLTEEKYKDIIDEAMKVYVEGKATAKEAKAFAGALKKDWKHIVAMAKKTVKSEAKGAKSKAKRATTRKTNK